MKRRSLLKTAMGASLVSAMPGAKLFAAPEDYTGRFFVTLQATGAWDVASFCDPKVNQPGEPEITRWSRAKEIQTAGNITYAPVANNAAFFNKYYRDMLVINGIDAQTNSHSTGVVHNWSGRNSVGYPSLTAMFARVNAPGLPLSYLNFGGYAETARLIRYTRLDNISSLINILTPNIPQWDRAREYRDDTRLSQVLLAQQNRLARLRQDDLNLPRQRYAMDAYYDARNNTQGLKYFSEQIPASDGLEGSVQVNQETKSTLLTQMQIAVLAFKSGAACSADLNLPGFDTHNNHDTLHEPLLAHLTDAVDYLWTYAEQQGIANRLTLLMASDFSRTPHYNSNNGKDHWPIGSAIIMERGAPWANRVIGLTDEGQNAVAINPTTFQLDPSGTIIYPRHIHKAMRKYLGLSLIDSVFPFNNTEDFGLFD